MPYDAMFFGKGFFTHLFLTNLCTVYTFLYRCFLMLRPEPLAPRHCLHRERRHCTIVALQGSPSLSLEPVSDCWASGSGSGVRGSEG